MADNTLVSNTPLGTYEVRTTNKTSKAVQHFILDFGGAGAESLLSTANPLPITNNESLDNFFLSDLDDASTPKFFGYTDKNENWYIMKESISSGITNFRYKKGTTDYETNWTNRASLTYDYFYNEF